MLNLSSSHIHGNFMTRLNVSEADKLFASIFALHVLSKRLIFTANLLYASYEETRFILFVLTSVSLQVYSLKTTFLGAEGFKKLSMLGSSIVQQNIIYSNSFPYQFCQFHSIFTGKLSILQT